MACRICKSPKAKAVAEFFAAGGTLAAASKRFVFPITNLSVHRLKHIPAAKALEVAEVPLPEDATPKEQAAWHCERIKARMVAAEKEGRTEKEIAGLYGQYTNALRHHAKLSGSFEVTLTQIVKHPDFIRARGLLKEVLGDNQDLWGKWEAGLARLMGDEPHPKG